MIITDDMMMSLFNKRTKMLTRKVEFTFALESLLIEDTMNFVLKKNEALKILMRNNDKIFDFKVFEKVFRKRNVLMGQGSHKFLDFLGMGLNVPMSFHPNHIFSRKYTKGMRDLISENIDLKEYSSNKET